MNNYSELEGRLLEPLKFTKRPVSKHCLFSQSGVFLLSFFFCFAALSVEGQHLVENIRLNQIGFYPDAPKLAVVAGKAEGRFYITTADLTDTVFAGDLNEVHHAKCSDKETRIADFSEFNA